MRPFQEAVLQPVRSENPTNNRENICGFEDTDDEDNADEMEESRYESQTSTKEALDR